jgi:hypothetical protein
LAFDLSESFAQGGVFLLQAAESVAVGLPGGGNREQRRETDRQRAP